MIKTIFILLLCVFSLSDLHSQICNDYYEYINLAELKALDNEFNESLLYYDSAFNTGIAMPLHLRNAFYVSAKLKRIKKSINFLDDLVTLGVDITNYIERMDNKEIFISSSYYSNFEKTYTNKLKNAQENYNDTIIDLLKMMAFRDQELRQVSYNEIDSIVFEQIKTRDTVNLYILMSIVKKYGWPNYSIVGTKYSGAANIILLHGLRYFSLDSYEWLFFEETLKQEVFKGNFYPITLAQWTDQHLIMIEKSKQKYGSMANSSGVIFPVENLDRIDLIRKEICLESFQDYLKKKNYKTE